VPKRYTAGDFVYEHVEGWPKQPVNGVAADVAMDSKGRLYVTVRNPKPDGRPGNILPGIGHILILDREGNVVGNWGDHFSAPHAVWVNPNDEIWMCDTGSHTVTKHAPSGEILATLGTPGQPGAPGAPFNMPTGAHETSTGELVVSDGYGQNWVHHFSARGELINSWGGSDPVFIQKFRGEEVTGRVGTGPGEFNLPHEVKIDDQDRVLIIDRENARWQVFDLAGTFLWQVQNVYNPNDLAVDADGNYHLVSGRGVEIRKPDGTLLGAWGERGEAPGQFKSGPHGVCMDANGDIYIAEVGANNCLQKFRRV
jgi:sugar lactone lactonase YvrE